MFFGEFYGVFFVGLMFEVGGDEGKFGDFEWYVFIVYFIKELCIFRGEVSSDIVYSDWVVD